MRIGIQKDRKKKKKKEGPKSLCSETQNQWNRDVGKLKLKKRDCLSKWKTLCPFCDDLSSLKAWCKTDKYREIKDIKLKCM